MIRIEVKGTDELSKFLDRWTQDLPTSIKRQVHEWGYQDAIPSIQEVLDAHKRTGRLAKSLSWSVKETDSSITLMLNSSVPYGRIQEYGGVITPKRVSWLTVPLPAALDGRGVAKRARQYPRTFFQWSRAGNLILFQNRGTGIVPLFVLRKKVVLPGIQYASRGIERALPKLFQRIDRVLDG